MQQQTGRHQIKRSVDKLSNVTPITKNAGRKATQIKLGGLTEEMRQDFQNFKTSNVAYEGQTERQLLEDVEAASSEHLLKLLALAHKREEFEREQGRLMGEANAELEHAVYFNHMAGLNEEAIYEVSERTADALSSAMRKVQAIA